MTIVTVAPSAVPSPPVSAARANECRASAAFWAGPDGLPAYAARMQSRSNLLAILTAVLGAISSLSVWTLLSNDPGWQAQLAVSLVALATVVTGTLGKMRNYGQAAGQAQELSSQFGHIKGALMDLEPVLSKPEYVATVQDVVLKYEAIKARKDALNPIPKKEQRHRNATR